ncbi:MAG: LysR family transcriptional regulator [Bacteroidota bacterium]
MNYTINQLRIFQKVVSMGSVTKAARALHLSQPAVSVQLRNFQNNFDLPLTEVIGRQLYVTEFGSEISTLVNQILTQLEAIDQQAMTHKGHLSGRLKIATASTGQYVLPYFLSKFVNDNPGIDLEMDVTNKENVVSAIKHNEVDICLVSIIPPKLKVNKLDLLPNELYLIGRADSPYDKASYNTELLAEIPLIYREPGSGTRRTMEQFIERKRLGIRPRLQLTSNEAVKQAVLAGLGYSIMPLIGIRNALIDKQLKVIPVKGLPITTTWSLIWLKDKQLAPVPSALVANLREEREKIIARSFSWLAEVK